MTRSPNPDTRENPDAWDSTWNESDCPVDEEVGMVAVSDGEGTRVADVDAGVLPCVADGDSTVGAGSCGGACLASPRHADSVTSRAARQRIARTALKWVSPNRSAMMDEAPIDCCDCDWSRSFSLENIRHGHRCHLILRGYGAPAVVGDLKKEDVSSSEIGRRLGIGPCPGWGQAFSSPTEPFELPPPTGQSGTVLRHLQSVVAHLSGSLQPSH